MGDEWVKPPENSIEAIRHGISHMDGVEFDLRLTMDNQLVLFHDNHLSREQRKIIGGSKINLKLPDNRFEVDYHQDFGYTPHTNDDIVTVLLLLDDMGRDDGAVKVVPGSHLEGQKSLWMDG